MLSYHPYLRGWQNGFRYSNGWRRTADKLLIKNAEMIIGQNVWSPIIWRDGIRQEPNFIEAAYLALDFDTPHFSLDAAINEVFCDYKCIIGTTKSHRKNKGGVIADRFRVIIPFSKKLKCLRSYRYNMHRALDVFEYADTQCKDGARFFFPCLKIRFLETDGEIFEVKTSVPNWFERPQSDATNFNEPLSGWARATLTSVIPIGTRNTSCYRLGKDLCKAGFDFRDAINLIIASPTYQGNVSDTLLREIMRAVGHGYKKVNQANKKNPRL
jgi:hypothetical protein